MDAGMNAYPRNDTQRSVEETKYEIHGDHGPQLVWVIGVHVLGLDGVDEQRRGEKRSRHNQRLNTSNLVHEV